MQPPAPAPDWEALGLMVGLEIHQQLDTPKLFCRCPSALDEDTAVAFTRKLRPTQSELGEVDRAALAEARKQLAFRYLAGRPSACLVEMDEEPPHAMGHDAVEVGLQFALLAGMQPVDEVHVMRKLVIDGSNTSGFQRTSMLALGGAMELPGGKRVGLQTLCLEEDSARRVESKGTEVTFRLDRLGIPLLEIATAPDLRSPAEARLAAEHLGMILRSTGRVRRGLGTIRQDLNISVRGGARVEIKGVQDLAVIEAAVAREVDRQRKLVEVAGQLRGSAAAKDVEAQAVHDLTAAFRGTAAKLVQGALGQGGVVLGLRLPGFHGLLGTKEQGWPRLGAELADHARVLGGVKGIFHSDELPGYGLEAGEVAAARAALGCAQGDALVLVAAPEAQARRALEAVKARALAALEGVPEETREVQEDGTSRFLRPLPGRARMYPETDVPPLRVTGERLARVRAALPELLPAREARMAAAYAVGRDELHAIVRAGDGPRFERLVAAAGKEHDKLVARLLLQALPALDAEVPGASERLPEAALADALRGVARGAYAKEALPGVLRELAQRGGSAAEAAQRLGFGSLAEAEVRAAVRGILDREAALIQAKGDRALSALMGDAMKALRGRADGALVSRVVREELQARLRG